MIKYIASVAYFPTPKADACCDNYYFNTRMVEPANENEKVKLSQKNPKGERQIFGVCTSAYNERLEKNAVHAAFSSMKRFHSYFMKTKDVEMQKIVKSYFKEATADVATSAPTGEQLPRVSEAIICTDNDRVTIANVGNVKIFKISDGVATEMTTEHTQAKKLVDMGIIQVKNLKIHPQRKRLVRYLGGSSEVATPSINDYHAKNGDIFIIMSGAFYDFIDENELVEAVASTDGPSELASYLISAYHNESIGDFTTVIVTAVDEEAADGTVLAKETAIKKLGERAAAVGAIAAAAESKSAADYADNDNDVKTYVPEKREEPKHEEPKYEEPKHEEPKYEEPKHEEPEFTEPEIIEPEIIEPEIIEPEIIEPEFMEPEIAPADTQEEIAEAAQEEIAEAAQEEITEAAQEEITEAAQEEITEAMHEDEPQITFAAQDNAIDFSDVPLVEIARPEKVIEKPTEPVKPISGIGKIIIPDNIEDEIETLETAEIPEEANVPEEANEPEKTVANEISAFVLDDSVIAEATANGDDISENPENAQAGPKEETEPANEKTDGAPKLKESFASFMGLDGEEDDSPIWPSVLIFAICLAIVIILCFFGIKMAKSKKDNKPEATKAPAVATATPEETETAGESEAPETTAPEATTEPTAETEETEEPEATEEPEETEEPGEEGDEGDEEENETEAPTEAPTTTAPATTAPATTAPATEAPTTAPTEAPTATPTEVPTATPTEAPTATPTEVPTPTPTEEQGDEGGEDAGDETEENTEGV